MDPKQGSECEGWIKVQFDMDAAEEMKDDALGDRGFDKDSAKEFFEEKKKESSEKAAEKVIKGDLKESEPEVEKNDTLYQSVGAARVKYEQNADGSFSKTKRKNGPVKRMPIGFQNP